MRAVVGAIREGASKAFLAGNLFALLNQLWHKRRIGGAGFPRKSIHSELSLINPCRFWLNRAKPFVLA